MGRCCEGGAGWVSPWLSLEAGDISLLLLVKDASTTSPQKALAMPGVPAGYGCSWRLAPRCAQRKLGVMGQDLVANPSVPVLSRVWT